MRLSSGKRKRLEAVSDSRGVIAALAIDQRDALRSLFSAESKIEKSSVPREQLEKFKSIVVRALSPHASAVLEHWSVRRLVDAGAHAIKALLYYALSDAPEILERKRVWVERVGSECAGCDVPFFLEIVPYQDGMDDKSPQFVRCKPAILTSAMREFSQPRYCVDVLKVGVPVTMAYVEGSSASSGTFVHTRAEALELFRQAAAVTAKPFLFLSAGVSNRAFNEALELASEAGVHFCGVLCGRATWKDGVGVFVHGGADALQEWLESQGVQNMRSINESLKAATPWSENYPADE